MVLMKTIVRLRKEHVWLHMDGTVFGNGPDTLHRGIDFG